LVKARADLAPKSNEVKTRDVALYELESKFDLVEGHKHNGTDSPRVTFNDLINIDIDSPADGEVLRWDNSTSNWINNTLAEADIASATSFETHTLSTTSVHGIDDTSDLVLKSGSINQLADITSSGVIVEDAVSKRHVQNTDVGTSSTTFYLGLNGPRIKGNLGAVEIRNSNDSDYADLVVQNLIVKGTTTTIESETVTFTDNILTLNSSYTGSTPIENGGLEIERGTLTNAAIIWDESNDLWRAGLANTEKTLVRESNIVALTGDVTGSAVFNSVGNVSILTEVQDDSHNHIISNIDELQNILDNKSDTTHTHAINDLTDVVLSTISNGEVLVYDSVTVGWVNKTLDNAGIATATHDHDTTYLGINATAVNSDKLDGQDGTYYLNWSNFTNTPTTISGYGITDAALESELTSHIDSTTSVHGITDTADLALKSNSINQFSDITSTGLEIEDAVSKKHAQNTDVGTSSPTFYIGALGPKIKNNSGVVELRNNADSSYTDLVVENVVVNGRLEVERGELVNASLVWDESTDLWKAGVVESEKTIVTEGSSVELTGDVTGTAMFNSFGSVSISTQVLDDSHNHIISNIDGLQDTLDSKSDVTHTHNYVSKTGDVMTGALTAPDYYVNDTSTRITEGLGDTVRLQTSSGYVDIGPQNTSYAHFQTDRNTFYFNKPLDAANQITVYGTQTFLSVAEGKIAGNVIWHAGNDGANSGLDADLLDGQQGSYYLNWSNFTNTPTTISGYGITDAALQNDLISHTTATAHVHGITNTADLALKSGSVNQFSDITSSGTIIEDAVSKRHNQNTDIGTSSTTFYIGTSGPKIKNNSGVFELKNNADTAYADLVVNNLVVKGSTTTIESETITFNDNILVLNNNYTGSTPTENAGLEVERGTLVNASLIWDESKDLWRTGLAGSEKTIVSEGNTVTVTGDTTGSAAFDSNGNISVSIQVVDDSHNHIISNIDGLQAALDSKSSTTHNHDSVYLKLIGGTLTGDLSINKALAVINAGTSSNNVLSLQSMGSVEVVIDNNNNDTNKLFAIKSNSQANAPITKVDETGNFTTAGYVAVYNGSAQIVYNASTESLDFVFV
jgi:hypothetical protein